MAEIKLFNQKWTFLKTAPGTELSDIADKKDSFVSVDIPHDWLISQTKDLYENSTGWYRKILDVSELGQTDGERVILRFDGVYTGYIGSVTSVGAVKGIFSKFLTPNAPIIVDPVFGDHGKLYRNFDSSYINAVRSLVSSADVILPNLTEACFLTNTPYKENYESQEIVSLHEKLRALGAKSSVITGIRRKAGRIAVSIDDGTGFVIHETPHIDRPSHGAGDVFASIVAGRVFSKQSLLHAACEAADFVCRALKETPPEHWYGLAFERLLSDLIK